MDQPTKVTSTEDTPMILDESTIKECIERDQLIKDISGSRGKLNTAKVECDKIKYAPIKEIFDTITPGKKYTIKNLLKIINPKNQNQRKKKKTQNKKKNQKNPKKKEPFYQKAKNDALVEQD